MFMYAFGEQLQVFWSLFISNYSVKTRNQLAYIAETSPLLYLGTRLYPSVELAQFDLKVTRNLVTRLDPEAQPSASICIIGIWGISRNMKLAIPRWLFCCVLLGNAERCGYYAVIAEENIDSLCALLLVL